MLIDVAKYVVTIVIIGGLISERINVEAITLGFILAAAALGIGFLAIPPDA